jgi:molybdopterin converting factor small subunit
MRVTAKYFAALKDLLSKPEDTFEIESGSIEEVLRLVAAANPKAADVVSEILQHRSHIVIAYNCDYVDDFSLAVQDLSEVALIPPGSGG